MPQQNITAVDKGNIEVEVPPVNRCLGWSDLCGHWLQHWGVSLVLSGHETGQVFQWLNPSVIIEMSHANQHTCEHLGLLSGFTHFFPIQICLNCLSVIFFFFENGKYSNRHFALICLNLNCRWFKPITWQYCCDWAGVTFANKNKQFYLNKQHDNDVKNTRYAATYFLKVNI